MGSLEDLTDRLQPVGQEDDKLNSGSASKKKNIISSENGRLSPPLKRKWVSYNKYLCNTSRLDKKGKTLKKNKKVDEDKTPQNVDQEVTKNTREFICELCSKIFKSKCSLFKHERIHTGVRPFKCKECDKEFLTKFALERHAFCHNPLEAKLQAVCDTCNKRFATKELLLIHSRKHSGQAPFSCELCDKKFNNQFKLNRHLLLHKEGKRFLCQECGKMFVCQTTMKLHLVSHITERSFNCSRCRMKFKRALDLRRHQLTHQEVIMIPCPLPQCEHEFRRKDNLIRHLQLTHDQTREEAHETFNLLKGSKPPADSVVSDTPREPRSRNSSSRSNRNQLNKRRRGKKKENSSITQVPQVVINNSPVETVTLEPQVNEQPNTEKICTSVTTSVIRMAKSSTQSYKPKNKSHDEPHQEISQPKSPPPRPQVLHEIYYTPIPPRNPSPGQEYINYLNSLNPIPYHVKERRSFNYSNYNHSLNSNFVQSNESYVYPERDLDSLNPSFQSEIPYSEQNSTYVYYQNPRVPEEFSSDYLDLSSSTRRNTLDTAQFSHSLNPEPLNCQEQEECYENQGEILNPSLQESINVVEYYERPVTVIKRASTYSALLEEESNYHTLQTIPQEIGKNHQMENFPENFPTPIVSETRTPNKVIGGKDMSMNRDPRKNFLWENFSKNRNLT